MAGAMFLNGFFHISRQLAESNAFTLGIERTFKCYFKFDFLKFGYAFAPLRSLLKMRPFQHIDSMTGE
jgi:hypothetical protein